MTRRWVRFTLLVLAVAAIGAGAFTVWTTERQLQRARAEGRSFDEVSSRLLTRIADLRAAQQAYVAAGQGEAFWIARVAAELARVRSEISALSRAARDPAAAGPLQTSTETLEDFAALDERVREYLTSGQRLMASDLIFADGLELLSKVAGNVTIARENERAADERAAEAVYEQAAWSLLASAGLVILCLLLLTPPPRVHLPVTEVVTVESAPVVHAAPPPVQESSAGNTVAWGKEEMTEVASLCTALGRVQDTRELPPLLERVATLLGARGLIVWIGGPDARELRPVLSHGYAPAVVARLGAIDADAENATAAAYRTGQLQIVRSDGTANGAVAAPLVSASGCVGVMAIEFRGGAESRAGVQPLATVVAAQLATLVSVAPESSERRNAEYGIRS